MRTSNSILLVCSMILAGNFAQCEEDGGGLEGRLQPVIEQQLEIVHDSTFALIGAMTRSDYNSQYYYYEYTPERFYWGSWRENHYALLTPRSSRHKIGRRFVVCGGENSTWKRMVPLNEMSLWSAILNGKNAQLLSNRELWEMVLESKGRESRTAFPVDEVPLRGRPRKIEFDPDSSILVFKTILERSTSVASFEVIEKQASPGKLALSVDRVYFGTREEFGEAENRFLHPNKWKMLLGYQGLLIAGKSIASIDYDLNDEGIGILHGTKFYPESSFVSTSLFVDGMLELSAYPFYDVRVEQSEVEKKLLQESQKRKPEKKAEQVDEPRSAKER